MSRGLRHLPGRADRLQPRRRPAARPPGRDPPDPRADRPLAPQIGRLYGGRDHSTVLNSLRRIEARIGDDPSSPQRSTSCGRLSTGRPGTA